MRINLVADKMTDVWDKELEPDFRKYTIMVAKSILAEEQAKGFDPNPRKIVDRRYDAQEESVKFGGKIEYVRRASIDDIVGAIYDMLVELSPIYEGDYQQSHIVMINGEKVVPYVQSGTPLNLQQGDRVQIVNVQPYARKIEGGGRVRRTRDGTRTVRIERSGGALSAQAPNGVYRVVWKWAQQRYGAVAYIDFKWVKLNLGVRVKARFQKQKVDQNYPAILIYQTAAGRGALNNE